MLKYKNRTNLHGQFLHFFKIYHYCPVKVDE